MIFLGCGSLSQLLTKKSKLNMRIEPITTDNVKSLVTLDDKFVATSCLGSEYVASLVSANLGVSVPTTESDHILKRGDIYILLQREKSSTVINFLRLVIS